MRRYVRLALLVAAALSVVGASGACQSGPPASSTPATATEAPPTAEATPAAPPGGVQVAIASIDWPTGPAVARVNGTDITTTAWREEVTRQLQLVTNQFQVDWNQQSNRDHLPEILDTILDRMMDLELLRQLAERDGVVASEEELQETAEAAKAQILASGQYEDLDAYLQANSLTQEQFDALIHEQAIINKLLEAHGGPSEAEQVHARHILVADEAKADEVLGKLAAGESFEELAKTYSMDTGSKDLGGDVGWFPRGVMAPEFEQAAFALQPGETSDPVQTVFGFHIIRVEERGVRALEEPILSQLREQNFMEWLGEERSAAEIERLYTASPTPTPAA